MKRIILAIIIGLLIISCRESNLKSDIQDLQYRKTELETKLSILETQIAIKNRISEEIDSKIENNKELIDQINIKLSDREPKYILKLKLKQSHLSWSIGKHIKDVMNAIEFELPVDKGFYDSINKGAEIVDQFRWGSLLLKGSMGDWKMTVVSKEIR